jgi:hypothetical protein
MINLLNLIEIFKKTEDGTFTIGIPLYALQRGGPRG